jgi:hypothetical protein
VTASVLGCSLTAAPGGKAPVHDPLLDHAWKPEPAAAALVADLASRVRRANPWAEGFAARLLARTGTRFGDWLDHLVAVDGHGLAERLRAAGFRPDGDAWRHPGGLFPPILAGARPGAALRVESVAAFLAAAGVEATIEGAPGPGLRRALVSDAGADVWAVERLGDRGFAPTTAPPALAVAAQVHGERFAVRQRAFADPAAGFAHAQRLVDEAILAIGRDAACGLFFAAERAYWQRRNRAARVQKARQDALGLGWANHDHHTYRSSRRWFAALIALCERLGFVCRERFYAGAEAGWGAQVLEHPVTGVVIFADVDLSPDELRGDFAREPLPPRERLGTVGLWCALHGEAALEAGMHHLEATFDFAAAREQLAAEGVASMKPFTDLPHLRQAFTAGERWAVEAGRVERLLAAGAISAAQAAQFRAEGAIGSHLEILERNDGFKGFNQHGVSEIIAATDPRLARG